ncbi:hypothetical protein HNR32_002560 [Pectinatus brassicae]|uniref:Uncharacterized protein n=1 Tax=Pectinatus brassicae TaxID=862415 RepID=A0A840UK65_9FIRM|nr:hypothetical protein [Pectinatus brassicae]MBB5337399.1 hypothetical protein [Pectinatus brassicae]
MKYLAKRCDKNKKGAYKMDTKSFGYDLVKRRKNFYGDYMLFEENIKQNEKFCMAFYKLKEDVNCNSKLNKISNL